MLRGIRDAMPTDPYAKTRFRAAKQAGEDMRRDEPWLWLFAHVVTLMIHPWIALRLWWLERSIRR
jgi:hypothetical protein